MKWNDPFKGLSVTLGHEFFISTLYSNPIIFSMCTYLMKISAIGGLEKSRILTGLLPQVSTGLLKTGFWRGLRSGVIAIIDNSMSLY